MAGPGSRAARRSGPGRRLASASGAPSPGGSRNSSRALFPSRRPADRQAITREVFVHLGRCLAEGLLLAGRHREALLDRVTFEGLEHLEAAQQDAGGRGVLLVSAHFGSWELGAACFERVGVRGAGIYRPLGSPALDRAARRLREGPRPAASAKDGSAAPEFEPIPMGRGAGVRFVRELLGGRSLIVLLDQHAREDDALAIDFFGRPARTRSGPLVLADRADVPVLCAFIRRSPDGRHHRVEVHPPLQLEPGASDDEGVLRRNLERVTAEIEQRIRATPGQWIWTHRRWREPTRGDRGKG